MKKSIALFVVVALALPAFGQIGFLAGYKTLSADGWDEGLGVLAGDGVYPLSGPSFALDYWFRLKNRRIEFTPEAGAQFFEKTFEGGSIEHIQAHFHFNTSFYLLDLGSDCNCPTFSKDGNLFSKGFFIEVSPGVSLLFNEIKTGGESSRARTFAPGGSLGAGLDLGISDRLTVTPVARFFYYPNAGWDKGDGGPASEADLQQFFAGVKLRFFWQGAKGFR